MMESERQDWLRRKCSRCGKTVELIGEGLSLCDHVEGTCAPDALRAEIERLRDMYRERASNVLLPGNRRRGALYHVCTEVADDLDRALKGGGQ